MEQVKRKIILAESEKLDLDLKKIQEADKVQAKEEDEKANPQTIEQAFEALEEILERLEDQDSALEDTFRYFERGMKLVNYCSDQIDKVEKKIIVLSEDEKDAGF